MSIGAPLRRLVRQRASHRCEYCQMPQQYDPASFEIDHVVPEKLDGQTIAENLALAYAASIVEWSSEGLLLPVTGDETFIPRGSGR